MKGMVTMTGLAAILMLSGCGGGEAIAPTNEARAGEPVGAMITAPTASSSSAASTTAPPRSADTLDAFWTTFRKAALTNDAVGIAALSAASVIQRGELDDGPVKRLTPDQVPPLLARLLDQPDGVDDAGRSQRAMLAATPVPRRDPQMPADRFRFGNMEFARGAAGWRLTQIYYEADD